MVTLYTFVTGPVAMVALLVAEDAEGLSLLTYLGLRTAEYINKSNINNWVLFPSFYENHFSQD